MSKHGLHLKHGLKVPWANLVFSERTIVQALQLQAQMHPKLTLVYPKLWEAEDKVRDVRRHRDLNDITHAEFLRMADECGYEVLKFHVLATVAGRVLRRLIPHVEQTKLLDVLSTGASALLQKR